MGFVDNFIVFFQNRNGLALIWALFAKKLLIEVQNLVLFSTSKKLVFTDFTTFNLRLVLIFC